MPLPLKTAAPNATTIQQLELGLTALVAGHPGSLEPWTFYEEIDRYLGPWGAAGYPINYGKAYCVLFNTNEKLQANPQTAEWVRRTTIRLQELVRDFIVERFRAGTLPRLTEPELRQAAFDSHPRAYSEGGLAMVVLVAPEMLPVIVSIPGTEFNPGSANFGATMNQVGGTLGMVAPQVAGNALAGLAGPAHTGLFGIAADRDRRAMFEAQNIGRALVALLETVRSGRADNFVLLDTIAARLNATEFPDQGFARMAREVIETTVARKRAIARSYRRILAVRPALGPQLDAANPGWQNF